MNDQLPTIARERIAYHPAIQERYGIDRGSWRALIDAVFPSATSIEGVILALSYCKSRNLDVFKRPVHIVPIWSREQKRLVETVWPGIGELRTTAFRTGDYAGSDEAVFGPDLKHTFHGDGSITLTIPEWCQITVYRLVRGEPRPWPGPRVYWLETYAKAGRNTEVPNEMWQKRIRGQIEKCAEAAALRKAFPEEVGEQYIGDEVSSDMRDITPAATEERVEQQSSPLHSQLGSRDPNPDDDGPGPSGGGGNRNTQPQAVRTPPGDDRSAAPDDTGASGRGAQRGADAAQSASSGPSAGKRTRRSYHDIKADVLAALASAADLAEVERVMKNDITSGVRANRELMDEIEDAEKSALARIGDATTAEAGQPEPVMTVLGKPAATYEWDASG